MNILSRYIGRSVLTQTALICLVLLTIYFFITLMDELKAVGQESYSMGRAVQYALFMLPSQLYQLFPMLALLGGLLGLGALASSNELTVIRAAGISVRRILLAVLKMALWMMLTVGLVGEFVAPPLEQEAHRQRARALHLDTGLQGKGGLWMRDGTTYIHMRNLLTGGIAHDITLYVYDDRQRLLETVYAHSARHSSGQWRLQEAVRSLIDASGITQEKQEELIWQSRLTPEVINAAALDPDTLPAADLFGYVSYIRSNGLDARPYELALWARLAMPFAVAGMMLLAVPFIFGSLRSVNIGLRVTVGGLLGIGFYMFNGIFGRVALVYDIPPALGALLPTLVVYALWWVLMRRVH